MEGRSTVPVSVSHLAEPECNIHVDADQFLRDPLKLEPSDECGEPGGSVNDGLFEVECKMENVDPEEFLRDTFKLEPSEPCGNVYDALFEVVEHAVGEDTHRSSTGAAHSRDTGVDAAGADCSAARGKGSTRLGLKRKGRVVGSTPMDTLTAAQEGRQHKRGGTIGARGGRNSPVALLSTLRATSRSRSRIGSVTPMPGPSRDRQSAARRAILLIKALDAPREATLSLPPPPKKDELVTALKMSVTPGGSINVVAGDAVRKTPGGSLRPASVRQTVSSFNELEAVGETNFEDDVLQDTTEREPWILQQRLVKFPFSTGPLSPTDTVEAPFANVSGASGIAVAHALAAAPTSAANVAKDAAAAKVMPSTSGMVATRTTRPKDGNGSDMDSEFDDEFDEPSACITALPSMDREIPDDDQLDEPAINIVHAVENAMDDAADRLGVSSSYDWVDNYESFRGVPEIFSGPTPGPVVDYDTPYDAFVDIWDKDIIELIVRETNRYAQQTIDSMKAEGTLKPSSRLHKWTPTCADEIMTLFAVYMYMALDLRTLQNEYWKQGDFLEMPKFGTLLSFNRFILLSKFLHFVDNSDVSQNVSHSERDKLSPRLAKLKPVVSHLNHKFSSLYNLASEIVVDESLTLFKGRLCWVQTIRSKAARFGIKSYELCESLSGYLYKFQFYTGKNSADTSSADNAPSTDLGGKSTKVVLDLLKTLEHRGHRVTMDNFYNCPALARYLKSLGFDCLGTLRPNRRNVPDAISKFPKEAPKGKIIARHCGDVSIVAWKDTRVVTMISTCHTDETYVGSRAGKPLVKPVCVRDYNTAMGSVDLKDQKLSTYLLERKRGVKWYIKMFRRLLNASIHNAYVMFVSSLVRRNKLLVTHREFRFTLAQSLADMHLHRSQPMISQVSSLTRLRKDIVHEPMNCKAKRMRCRVCLELGKRTTIRTKCVTCDAYLCFENCWREWHSTEVLNPQKTRGRKRRIEYNSSAL